MSKIAGIYWDDTAAAPGISLSVYFSGCHFHCPGCHNPEAQDFNYGREYDLDIRQEIMQKLGKNGVMRTLSILGGEPLNEENIEDVINLIGWCKLDYPDLKIYVWTGYTIEELEARLRGRHTETEDAIQKRLASIKLEIENSKFFDYKIVNDTVENAVKQLEEIIMSE